jgi:3-phenylpropionate/trans-cinnamate dioxygenase ferredoxin reductase subunit
MLLIVLEQVVVVGAGLGGAKVCEQLRARGYAGRITLLGAEPARPYDRPPLTKAVLLGKKDDTTLNTDLGKLDVDARLGEPATGLRVEDRVVETASGEVSYDGLVIATGARPVTLPGGGKQYVVRTLDDALQLRAALQPGARVVVVGASWIGAEVATAALAHGCRVTCVEAGPTVSHMALGAVGKRLEQWWEGVDLHLGVLVASIEDGTVDLVGGGSITADVVVVGVGVRPEVDWLRNSGLELDRAVLVDEWLRAADGVVAIGDASAWWSRRFERRLRVEHWDNAVAAASVAATTLLEPDSRDRPVYDPVPYFWSDQFGHKVQYVGAHDDESRVIIRSSEETGRWSAIWLDPADRVTAMLVIDRPRDLIEARKLIENRAVVAPERLADGDIPLAEYVAS